MKKRLAVLLLPLVAITLLHNINAKNTRVGCKNGDGKDVDWWIALKVTRPDNLSPECSDGLWNSCHQILRLGLLTLQRDAVMYSIVDWHLVLSVLRILRARTSASWTHRQRSEGAS
jgi:hypothetical protein